MTSNTPESNELSAHGQPQANRGDSDGADSHESPNAVSSNCLKWARGLEELLNDTEGLHLFQKYLEQEDHDRFYMLKFWYACRGVPQQNPVTAHKAIGIIYRELFLKIKSGIKDEVRKSITNQMREAKNKISDPNNPNNPLLTVAVFSEACKIVENEMYNVMYPNFIGSDLYMNYVHKMQDDHCILDTSSHEAPAFPEDVELPVNFSQPFLPVLEEDKELLPGHYFVGKRRSSSSRSSTLGSSTPVNTSCNPFPNCRLYHNSYTQNSELASVSSGARTESVADLTLDDAAVSTNAYVYQRQRQMLHSPNIILNKDSGLLPVMPPRTSNPLALQQAKPQKAKEFARELTTKLEKLIKNKESLELVDRKLSGIELDKNIPSLSEYGLAVNVSKIDDDDQEILDKHVSRIWSDKTPKQSPVTGTPICPESPTDYRRLPLKLCSRNYAPGSNKPKKDYCSLFSLDSGNFTDLTEDGHSHRKHKSFSESGHSAADHHSQACYQRGNRAWTNSRRTLTDSGVSDLENSQGSSSVYRERIAGFPGIVEEKDAFVMSSSKHKPKSMSGYSHSSSKVKSGVPDRAASSGSGLHTFVTDPNMPPFSYHNVNTDVQLDEACRRLNEGIEHKSSRSIASTHGSCASTRVCESIGRGSYSQSGFKTETPPQRSSTLTRTNYKSCSDEQSKAKSLSGDDSISTTVVYNFNDEKMPYLLRVPGSPITLKLFKEYMPPKKLGRYRYFFVTSCEELGNQLIQEEITDDNQFLPLWRGKVNAQIKAIE